MLRLSAVVLLLAACGSVDDQPRPGGTTMGEARALDDAASMLSERGKPEAETPAMARK